MTGTVQLVSTFAGRVVQLAEADRVGGVGPVVVRIHATGGALGNPSVEWIRVVGTQVLGDGRDGGELDVLARAEAVRSALDAAPPRPGCIEEV